MRQVRVLLLLLLAGAVLVSGGGNESSAHTNTFAPTSTLKLCGYSGAALGTPCTVDTLTLGGNADITTVITVPYGQMLLGAVAFTPSAASIPGPETNTLCLDALDNDADTKVNDSCPTVGFDLESNRCESATNNDLSDDSLINDGCPASGAAESFCTDALDNDGDGKVNDGCPAVGGAQAETNAWCDNATDDDPRDDAAGGGSKVNDGCPVVGAAETVCTGAADEDGDTKINDGCPTAGGIEAEVNECENGSDDDVDTVVNDGCPIANTPIVGAVAGKAYTDTKLSLLNGPCNGNGSQEVILMNATTDNGPGSEYGALPPGAIWSEGPMEPFRDDVNGNAVPSHVDRYPAFLNLVFDPDRVGDINGDGDDFDTVNGVAENPGASALDWYGAVEPVRPLARYSGSAIGVGNQAQLVQLLVFAPGAFAAYPRPHPLWDLASTTLGYPMVLVVNDPTVIPGPNAPQDVCSPGDIRVMLWGKTRDNPCLGASPACPNDDTPCFILCGDNNCINGNSFAVSGCPALVDSPNGGCSGNDTGGCVRYANPVTAGTYYWRVYQQSQRDADDDGIENSLDTCPYTATTGFDPRVGYLGSEPDPDSDGLPSVCDPTPGPGGNTNSGNHDGDTSGGNPWFNRGDNCPLVSNPDQKDSEIYQPYYLAAPIGGSRGDGIGDACDGAGAGPETLCSDALDADADTRVNDGCATVGAAEAEGASLCANTVDDDFADDLAGVGSRINDGCAANGAAETACNDGVDDDADTLVNDGCPTVGGATPESIEQCSNSTNDDSGDDGLVNDGCGVWAANAGVANGHFHTVMSLVAKCIGATDSDVVGITPTPDGYCDATETALGSSTSNPASTPEDPSLVVKLPLTNGGSGGTTATPGQVGEPKQVCNDGIDNDLDTFTDAADGTLSGSAITGCLLVDTDGDGWNAGQESLIYNVAATLARDIDACGNDGWGLDLWNGDNKLNVADINSFLSPPRLVDDGHGTFNMYSHPLDDDGDTIIETNEDPPAEPGVQAYNVARWNLQLPPHLVSTQINIGDLNALTQGAVGSPAYPPMFGGLKAFSTDLDGPGPLTVGQCPFRP